MVRFTGEHHADTVRAQHASVGTSHNRERAALIGSGVVDGPEEELLAPSPRRTLLGRNRAKAARDFWSSHIEQTRADAENIRSEAHKAPTRGLAYWEAGKKSKELRVLMAS